MSQAHNGPASAANRMVGGGGTVLVAFDLMMPGCGSWDGRWSAAAGEHVLVRRIARATADALAGESYGYCWSDGWRASISCRVVDVREARRLRLRSAGFCGYDWMVESIIAHGAILSPSEER